jgi:hypothetical protein
MAITLRQTAIGLAALCLITASPIASAAEGDAWDWMVRRIAGS